MVADEIRKLAEKTMRATKEVGESIKGIQACTKNNIAIVERSGASIESACDLANHSGASLREIVSLVESSTDQVQAIARASEQQAAMSREVNQRIFTINEISSSNSENMRLSALAIGKLANQARNLKKLIEEMEAGGANS